MRILFGGKFSACKPWIPHQFWFMHMMTHFLGSDGCLADLMVFLRAQSLFAILHSRLDDILPAECVIIYLRTVFPCKCFPWICLEIPRNILLFSHLSNAVDDVCLAYCRKGLMATNSTMYLPFQTYLHLHFYPKRSFSIRGSIYCQKYLHLYYKLQKRILGIFCIKSHPFLLLKDQYEIIFLV